MAYDIFISYRRRGAGAGVAGELQAKLENLGYKVFLDVDEIGSGQFPTQIEKAIEDCKDFLLVLSPGTLDRCADEDDWVRREILQARTQNKNIIGVGLPGFVMPEAEKLPAPLQSLTTIQVFLWTHEYRTASFEKIEENLVSSVLRKKKNKRKLLAFSLASVVIVAIVAFLLFGSRFNPEGVSLGSNSVQTEYQTFNYHVNRALELSRDLPDIKEFKENFLQLVSDKKPFLRLMESIAECDTAILLKKEHPDIADTYNVENQRSTLLQLRKDYMNVILDDVAVLLVEDGAIFAQQDMEIAGILTLPDEKPVLDSLNSVIKRRITQ